MKYFVVSDIHGFYTELIEVLGANGFDESSAEHKVIVCGDIMDRGKEAVKLQTYISNLIQKDKVILVRGNHESLMLDMLDAIECFGDEIAYYAPHHISNGTLDTLFQLTGMSPQQFIADPDKAVRLGHNTPFVKEIIPSTINYFETKNYIFVHGWIPCTKQKTAPERTFLYDPEWRNANFDAWEAARWLNGMDCAVKWGVVEPNKTIVCGHFHTSYGHANFGHGGSEFDKKADFSPFSAPGIIAIDACTAYSHQMNCLVIDD